MARAFGALGARVVEATTQIIPAEGFTIEQALADAQLEGYQSLVINDDNTATVTWFKEAE